MVTTVCEKWLVCALGWQMHEQVNELRNFTDWMKGNWSDRFLYTLYSTYHLSSLNYFSAESTNCHVHWLLYKATLPITT